MCSKSVLLFLTLIPVEDQWRKNMLNDNKDSQIVHCLGCIMHNCIIFLFRSQMKEIDKETTERHWLEDTAFNRSKKYCAKFSSLVVFSM